MQYNDVYIKVQDIIQRLYQNNVQFTNIMSRCLPSFIFLQFPFDDNYQKRRIVSWSPLYKINIEKQQILTCKTQSNPTRFVSSITYVIHGIEDFFEHGQERRTCGVCDFIQVNSGTCLQSTVRRVIHHIYEQEIFPLAQPSMQPTLSTKIYIRSH